ncbi:unnamed protein product [Hymenolepis diminuta]|uniref:Uncharacterized protein n=1 Tax=Hymenolepis diminuta TaxID=6216 RepID=A0A564Z1P5_HYMDI|nr:unnamed protein product [Hymenolepis diminuta]
MTDRLSTDGTYSPSDKYQKQSLPRYRFYEERRYHRDCLSENVAARTTTKMTTKKVSADNLLRTI